MSISRIEELIDECDSIDSTQKIEYKNILSGAVTRDDRKEATKIALDASRSFVTISLAVLALNGLFFRMYTSDDDINQEISLCLLLFSSAFLLISISAGFLATSKAFKVADGRQKTSEPTPWGTKRIAPHLNIQSLTGALAVLATTAAVIFA